MAEERGGVGLVFRKDDDDDRFLIVHKVSPGGPADTSGSVSTGDRLIEIDGVSLGAASPDRAPQLPGAHGSRVQLCFQRGRIGQGAVRYSIYLVRDKGFFPDKLLTEAALRKEVSEKSKGPPTSTGVSPTGISPSKPPSNAYSPPRATVESPTARGFGAHSRDALEEALLSALPSHPPSSTNQHIGSLIPDPYPRFSLGGSFSAPRDHVVVEEDTPPPSVSKPPRPSLVGRAGAGDRRPLDVSAHAPTGLDPRGERLAALETEVVEMSLQLEAARAEVAAERQKGFEALAKQGDQLRKERETSEARLMLSLGDSGKESDALRAKNLELSAQLRKLERKRAELQREKDDLQEAFLEKTQGVERDTAAAHRLETSRLKADHSRNLEELKADFEHKMSVLKLEQEAALAEQRQKAHDQLVKTTNAMRVLTDDLKDARTERDGLEMELEKAKQMPHRAADVRTMQEAAQDVANAQSEASHLRKEAQRLQLELERAREGEGDAMQQRDRLARELVMARAGMALAESDEASLTNGRRFNHAAAPEPEPEVAEALTVAEGRQAERNAPFFQTPARPGGGKKEHDLTHSFSTPAVQRVSGLPRQSSPAKKLAPEDRAHPAPDPSLDIMRMYLGEATPRPAREESPAPAPVGGGSVRVEIVRGRKVPTVGAGGGEVFFRARLGGREVEGKRAEGSGDVEWGHSFELRCPNEGGEGEMVTLLLTGTERGGRGGGLLGYVAVPMSRLRASGQESGWYVLRTSDDKALTGDDGAECEALLRLTMVEGSEEASHVEGGRVGIFGVEIAKGRGVPTSVGDGCYVAVQVSGQQRRTAVASTAAPQWSEVFTLAVSKTSELCSLMLWNADSNTTDPYIGHVAVPVDRVMAAGGEEGWYEVRDQSGDIVPAPGGAGVCQILARFSYRPAPEGALGPVTGWLKKGQLRGFFVLDPYLCELSRFDTKEDASLGARAGWCVSAVGCRVSCPPRLAPLDTKSFEVEAREEEGPTVLTADTATEARLWADAIKQSSQEQAGDEIPVNASAMPKGMNNQTPAVQLQAAIQRDQEEAAKRRKELDELEEKEARERERRDLERREREKDRREEREREQAKREEERDAREREIRIEMGKESLAILQKETEEERRLAAQEEQDRAQRERDAEKRRQEEARQKEEKEATARKEALRVLAQQRTQHASAPEAPPPPAAPAHGRDSNPPPDVPVTPPKPDAVVEAYVLKGRNIPVGEDGSVRSIVAALQVGTPGTAPAVSVTTTTPPPSGSPVWNESFQFPIASPPDTLVTIMVWAVSQDGKRSNLGHIAVPVSRVAAATKEEGWYEVRKSDGQVQTGENGGKTALLVSLTYTDVTKVAESSSCWVAALSPDASSWKRRFAVLDPYRQTILMYRSDEDATARRPAAQEFNLRACTSDPSLATSKVATAVESITDPPPPLPPNPPKCAIHLCTHFDSLTIVLPTEAEAASWNSLGVATGNPPTLKKMPPPPHAASAGSAAQGKGSALGLKVEVSVEKGRNLPTQNGGVSGTLHCAVQVGSSQSATQTEEVASGTAVKWNTPAFRLPAQSEADLIAVMLIAKCPGQPDTPIGHIAVPVSRVVATSKEEGWYEIRTQGGQVVKSDDGASKASLLIRFRVVT